MAPPQWAYQVENFVTKPDEELICSICHAVFCEPVICPCDHVFCKICISKWLQTNRNCPICRNRVPKLSIKQMVPIVKNLIMKLILYCKNKEYGCEAQFTLESCEGHMKECSFELVQCKNKPCKVHLHRRDILDHEANYCLHRFIKCEKCGSKMPLSSPENHNCIRALQLRLKRKNTIIRKRDNSIQELKNEIKSLKEASLDSPSSTSSQSSIVSNLSPDEIRINIAEIDVTSSDSEGSTVAIISNSSIDYSSNDNIENELVSSSMQNQDNAEFPRNETFDSNEHQSNELEISDNQQNDSCINDNRISFLMDGDEDGDSEKDDQSIIRRPAKRRLPPLNDTSDEDNELEGHPSLPSPKRCWRLQPAEGKTSNKTGESSNSYMDAGPSSASASAADFRSSVQTPKNKSSSFCSKSKLSQRCKEENSKKAISLRSASSRGNAVFERTLALLEQYSLESDSDWYPEYASHRGDTSSESDSSNYEVELQNDSSDSIVDSVFFVGTTNVTPDLLRELRDSDSSESDPTWPCPNWQQDEKH